MLPAGQNSALGSNTFGGAGTIYPTGLNSIPYASLIKITKYSYKAGLARAKSDSARNDVFSALTRSGLGEAAVNAIRGTGLFLFNDTDKLTDVEEAVTKATKRTASNIKLNQMGDVKSSSDYSNVQFPITLSNGTVIENADQLKAIKNKANSYGGTENNAVMLPMPNEFQYSYGAAWSNEFKLGTLARLLENPAAFAGQAAATGTLALGANVAGQILGGATDVFSQALSQGAGIPLSAGDAAGAAASGAFNPLGVNSELTPTNLLGLGGLAPNENAIMFFSKMEMRSFDLTFELFARNKAEADQITSIIQFFKVGMHPYASPQGVGGVLGFPDIFELQPMFVTATNTGEASRLVEHPQMPRTKACALTRVTVNTAPANQFTTTFTGDIPLQTITLSFSEITALSQSDMKSGQF